LLVNAQQGDFEAFAELVKAHDDRMRALAYRCLGSRDLMEDALQVAYIRCFQNLSSFRGEASFGTWLHRIVFNACHDLRTKTEKNQEVSLEVVDLAAQNRSFEDQLADRDWLNQALDALPFDHRTALILVDSQGLSYGEAADLLGIAEGTLASRLHRARAAVREQLSSFGRGVS